MILWDEILGRVGLSEPDGRPLRRYSVSDDEYKRIGDLLRLNSTFLSFGNEALVALFGLYVAEWFRREATSTTREWHRIGIVPEDMGPNERTELVEASLSSWRVDLKRSERGREALLSLALQGGIPIRILRAELESTLSRYFRTVMGETIAVWPCDAAHVLEKAKLHEDLLVQTLRDPLIIEQAAEAVYVLCDLRKKIPGDVPGDAAVGWLDANIEGWRERIPLYLPDNGAVLDALFGDMLREQPARVRRESKVTRVLDWKGGTVWRTGIALPANGPIPPDVFDLTKHAEGRFLLHLRGEASVAFPGALGHLYHRPGRGAIAAALTCELGRNAEVDAWNVPLSEPIRVRFSRSDVEPFECLWPGGAAMRSDVIGFYQVGAGRFEFAGTGSVRSKAETLLVLVPLGAEVTVDGEGTVERLGEQGRQALWHIQGIATVALGDGRYRLFCGAEAEARWLEVPESWRPGLRLTNRELTLMEEGYTPRRRRVGFTGEIEEGRIEMRARKGSASVGRLTCTWRDEDGFVIDRQRVFVLPSAARIEASEGRQGGAHVRWSGLQGWTVAGSDGAMRAGNAGEMDFALGTRTRVPLMLIDPGGAKTEVSIDLKVRDAHLVDTHGNRIANRDVVPLERMNMLMLRLPRTEQVDLMLRGIGSQPLIHTEPLEGDAPLQILYAAATHLFALAGDQDARIELTVQGRALCQISRPRDRLLIDDPHVNIPPGSRPERDDWQVVARPLIAGDTEHPLDEGHPPWSWRIPARVDRPCMIYLRTERGVLTRPQVLPGPSAETDPWSAALTSADPRAREGMVLDLLTAAVQDRELLKRIRKVIVSLHGLSPQSTDILRLLDRRPETLCALVLSANESERPEIFALSERLPFLWPGLPVDAWVGAAQREMASRAVALKDIYDDAPIRAMGMVREVLTGIAADQPWFDGIREVLGEALERSGTLYDLADQHVKELGERPGCPRSLGHLISTRGIRLPDDIARFDHATHTALLAPLVLAASAVDPFELGMGDRWALRAALLFDHTYVSHAYPHCLRFLRS